MADVSISYKGNEIASMNATGVKTLLTSSAFCEDDITVSYTKPSGGGPVSRKQVNFIDYDGTILYSYTKAEITAMTSESDLPANPSHTGLTAQGWNWTLTQIKAQLTAVPDGEVWVGQMYITANGKTEIDVRMPSGRLSPILTIAVNGTVSIDWGDNTTPDTVTGSSLTTSLGPSHTYASAGDYTISISVTSGSFAFYGTSAQQLLRKNTTIKENNVYSNCVRAIRIGSGITKIGQYTLSSLSSLSSITIPSAVTSMGNTLFTDCYALESITLPSGLTGIGDYDFSNCYSLSSISIPSSVTSINGNSFGKCYSLAGITIPKGVTSIGSYAFNNCSSLQNIAIPSSVTSIGTFAFNYCYSLRSISIPSGVTSIANTTFNDCFSLSSIIIPSGVTSIGNSALSGCRSISSITIPSSVTSIGNTVFQNFYGLKECHILPTTVPTGGTNMFRNIPSDCIIYVPASKLSDYKGASNWSTYASYMQGE